MKVSVSMWSYFHPWKRGELDIAGFIREAQRAGAEGVELLDFFYKDIESDRAAAKAALVETGLPVPIFSVAQNFAQADPTERQKALEKILFGIGEAKFYGSGVVRVFAGNATEGVTYNDAHAWIVDGLSEASRAAEVAGVKLGLENHGKLAGRSDQIREIIDEVRNRTGTTSLGANPDTGNFLLVNQPSEQAIAEIASYATMVHFKDFAQGPIGHEGFAYEALNGQRFVGTAVGEGEVKLSQCIQLLREAGFDGWLSVEYEGEESPFTAVPRSIAAARALL
jgi:sugar phosphate isomerase/epimerase